MTGSERLGWSQSAPSRQEVDAYQHAAYVDGQRVAMAKASCTGVDAQTYDCSAPLPQMSIGRHTLELVAILNGLESARSQGLVLTVGNALQGVQAARTTSARSGGAHGSDALAVPAPRRERACIGSGGECYDVERLSTTLADPHALAVFPDGRIVVAEQDARVLAFGDNGASQLQIDSPCRAASLSRINAIAPDPLFAQSRLVYVAWSCDTRESARELLIVRYREINGTFGEAAAVFREAGVAKDDALIAVTRDRRVTVAIPHADRWDIARVTTDGRVPPESTRPSPVLLQRRSVAALTIDTNTDRVTVATADGRLEALDARRTTRDLGTPIAAAGIAPDATTMFVASVANRRSLQRFLLSAATGSGRATPAAVDFDLGGDATAIAVAPDGSIAVLTRPREAFEVSVTSGSLLRLHPAFARQ